MGDVNIKDCQLWHDDTDWYWAKDLEHLDSLIKEREGHTYEDMVGEPIDECWSLYGAETFKMHYDDLADVEGPPGSLPKGCSIVLWTSGPRVEATLLAWRDVSKPGFFASTEW